MTAPDDVTGPGRKRATKGETIFALASGAGMAGLAVVRVSGPNALCAGQAICGRMPAERELRPVRMRDPRTGETLDRGMAVWFGQPASFTGEDVVELHLHGGRAVVAGVCAALAAQAGLRLAEPGEFTRRAFDHGKLDLTRVEGLADLVSAETAAQRRQAVQQLEGSLGRLYEEWRARLISVLAHFEAAIDFAEEELPPALVQQSLDKIEGLVHEITLHLDASGPAERIRSGVSIALVGAPNVGKSSLMNCIAGREIAIVSEQAGTTRDVLECHLDLGGYPVLLSDLAGLREAMDPVEAEGIRRARARAESADFILRIYDSTECNPSFLGAAGSNDSRSIIVLNKADQADMNWVPKDKKGALFVVSALTGNGIERLLSEVTRRVESLCAVPEEAVFTRHRHRAAVTECHSCLKRALGANELDMAAEDVRLAVRSLGLITGRVDVEDVLDLIFGEFCIGK
jgi:tRNA modification GTPase